MEKMQLQVPDVGFTGFKPVNVVAMGMDAINTDTLLIGQGFNTVTGEQGGAAVKYSGEKDLVRVGGENGVKVNYRYETFESLQTLRNKLNISATASLGLGVFNSDLAFEYLRGASFCTYNKYLMVDITVTNPAEVLRESVLTGPAVLRTIGPNRAKRFLAFAGNTHVYGRVTGGQLTVVLQFSSTTSEDAQRVSAAVEASAVALRTGGKIETEFKNLSSVTSTSLHLVRRGTSDKVPTLDELAKVVASFPTRIAKGKDAVVLSVLLRGYESATRYPAGLLDYDAIDRQAQTLATVARHMTKAYSIRGETRFMIEQSHLFEEPNVVRENAEKWFDKNEAIIEALAAKTAEVKHHPEAAPPAEPEFPRIEARRKAAAPPPPEPPPVEIFEHIDYGGQARALYNSDPWLDRYNDMISSVKVNGKPGEYRVEVFRHADFKDRMFEILGPALIGNFWSYGRANDEASSIRITRQL